MEENNTVYTNVLVVGGGISGLSFSIALADILDKKGMDKRIILLDKGASIGSHILSGAVIRPWSLKELLSFGEFEALPFDTEVTTDDIIKLDGDGSAFKLPVHPPYMSNKRNYLASLGEICRYLAKIAEKKGVEIYSGFSVKHAIFEDGKIVGVKTTDTGLNKEGKKEKNFQEGTIVKADITILAEGSRGNVTKEVISKLDLDAKSNPQIYSLGIKELWEVPNNTLKEGSVYHTVGFPLKDKEEFGGGFIYSLKNNKIALGLIVGLDYDDPTFDIQAAMQLFKQHPFVSEILANGKILEAGAKTLPEGGWDSIPRVYDNNLMIIGDSAGFLSTASLKGVDFSVYSGICAAKTAALALEKEEFSKLTLCKYKELILNSPIYQELHPTRHFRSVMKNGLLLGGIQAMIGLLLRGHCLFKPKIIEDYLETKRVKEYQEEERELFDSKIDKFLDKESALYIDKPTLAYLSKTKHEESQPLHLIVKDERTVDKNIKEYSLPCRFFCPAEVYELHKSSDNKESLRIHAENCVHCKTCDIKAPNNAITWTTPYGGDGPDYNYM